MLVQDTLRSALFVILTKEESRVSCSRLLRFFLRQNDKIIDKASNLITSGARLRRVPT